MLGALLLVVGGLLLWRGGDWFVDGADRFGRSHGMPATLAGVFILGFGTSAPELAASVFAVFEGRPGIAAGNVVGSNIANVALILGVTASIAAVPVNHFLQRVEIPVGIAASLLAILLVFDGAWGRVDGLVLLVAFAAYAAYAMRTARKRDLPEGDPPPKNTLAHLGLTVVGLAAVLVGAKLFIQGAEQVAAAIGLSDAQVGLTLVALGTSMPELATGLAAARARQLDMALGNVVGSNIFNLLLVLGTAATLAPQEVEPLMLRVDLPVMLGFAILLWVLGRFARRVPRRAGAPMAVAYVAYFVLTSVRGG